MSDVTFLGYDSSDDKVWQHADGRVAFSPTEAGAAWSFDCGSGKSLETYIRDFGPITKEKP